MTAEFLEEATAAIEWALEDGEEPVRWELTHTLYAQLDYGPGHFGRAKKVYIGNRAPELLHNLPVDIIAGPTHEWRLHTDGGRRYDGWNLAQRRNAR